MTRRVQIFVEGGFYGADELADMLEAAIAGTVTDNGKGEDERGATEAEKQVIVTALKNKLDGLP